MIIVIREPDEGSPMPQYCKILSKEQRTRRIDDPLLRAALKNVILIEPSPNNPSSDFHQVMEHRGELADFYL